MARRTVFARIVAIAAALAAMPGGAAAPSFPPLQPGELLHNGSDQQIKVLQCRPVVYGRECETVLWEDGRAASNPSWWDEVMLVKGDARVREALGKPPRAGAAAPRAAVGPAPAKPATAPRPAPAKPATPAQTASTRIPDGAYTCQMWMGSSYVSLGSVRSVGGKLASNPLAKVGATITGVTSNAQGITINYMTARGYRESMDCKRG